MSKITVTTIAGLTSGGDANKVKIESGDTLQVESNATVGGTLGVTGAITGTTQTLNRSGDGDLIAFQKDGTTVGSIGSLVSGRDLHVNSSGGILTLESNFNSTERQVVLGDTYFGIVSNDDNAVDLGRSSARYKDLYLGGGLYVGGTGAANKLDDYEEGTWTPTLGGNTTYHAQVGKYTKIGNVVHVGAVIQANVLGTGSTTTVSGLPFTSSNAGAGYQGGDIGFYYFLANNVMSLDVQMGNNTTTCGFSGRSSAGNTITSTIAVFGNGARIDFSITYYVA